MHRQELLSLLARHETHFVDEQGFKRRAIDFISRHEDCFYRELWPLHVTGSTWVVNKARDHVLMMHHKKLNRWFQPGGHADGDADILRVALRETAEETGLSVDDVRLLSASVFDVDIHTIPAMNNEPRHEHIDVRFLVEIDDCIPVPGNDESHEILWVSLYQVARYNSNRSTNRMLQKTRELRNRVIHAGGI